LWELGGCIASKKMVGGCEIPMSSPHTHTHFAFHEKYVMDDGHWWFALLPWPPSCNPTHLIAHRPWSYSKWNGSFWPMGWGLVGWHVSNQNVKVLQFTWKHAFSYKAFVSFFHQIEHFKSKLVEHSTRRINCSKSSTKSLGFNLQEVGIGIVLLPVSQKKKKTIEVYHWALEDLSFLNLQ
jgi:hypothetical protein